MGTDAAGVLTTIASVVRSRRDYSSYIHHMLAERNWPGHLVALAAVLLSREPAQHASNLWRTFDRGSWVAPQLAVALYWADPGFIREAKRRILGRCPIDDDDGFFRGDTLSVSAKNLASVMQVVAVVPSETSWVASELLAQDVKELLRADQDDAGAIARSWLEAAQARFAESGHPIGAT
jgi:hypothetical protein